MNKERHHAARLEIPETQSAFTDSDAPASAVSVSAGLSADSSPQFGEKGQVVVDRDTATKPSLIAEEVSLPVAVLRASALQNNLDWMQRFATHHQVKLAPHGKTSMTPALFEQQLAHGAWGITVATAPQAQIAAMAGAQRIIMANQLIGRANMALIQELLNQYPVTFYCCVDSKQNAQALNAFFAEHDQTLNVLIEYGVTGGRCGCRTPQQVLELSEFIANCSHLQLAGIEVYEGVISGQHAEQSIREFVDQSLQLALQLVADGLCQETPIVTGAGSAWYDVVAECLANLKTVCAVIRPGCYAIHDNGIYLEAQQKVMQRAQQNRELENQGAACDLGGDLQSALELWAYVQSRPEPSMAIIGFGKRDAAFDAGLPSVIRLYRDGKALENHEFFATSQTVSIMDQHAMLHIKPDADLQVGDVLVFTTSHPCLTIDKWRALAVCDDDYQIINWVETRF